MVTAWSLTVADALYVVLAEELDATLVTGDLKLANAPGLRPPTTLVDESDRLSHTDPMGVDTAQNPLVESLVPFLSEIG